MDIILINDLLAGKRVFCPAADTGFAILEFQSTVKALQLAHAQGWLVAVFQKPSKGRTTYGRVLTVCVKRITPVGLRLLEGIAGRS